MRPPKKKKQQERLAELSPSTSDSMSTSTSTSASKAFPWSWAIILAAAIVAAYLPVWRAGFIHDDAAHLTANPCIVGPLGLKEIWTTRSAVYYPLALTSFWLQHAVWGLHPLPYHLVNVALHAANALLLWRVLLRLGIPFAWMGAALWALHPVQVESVAWVSELKNTQSGFFCLLAVLFYLDWRAVAGPENPSQSAAGKYALALACGVLAILSKTSTVMLPVILGLCSWWLNRQRRWRWEDAKPLVPFLVLSLIAGGWTIWIQNYLSGAMEEEWSQSLPERLAIAGGIPWFYLKKLLLPHPLVFIYPRWDIQGTNLLIYLPLLATLAAAIWLWRGRRGPLFPWCFALGCFMVSLFPVLGLFHVYYFRFSFVADHFQYLASMGPLVLAGVCLGKLADFLRWRKTMPSLISGALVLLALGILTWRQTRMYRNMETLWLATLAHHPACWMAWSGLGLEKLNAGKPQEALGLLQKALDFVPNDRGIQRNLANALLQAGQAEKAVALFEKAVALKPEAAGSRSDLGAALLQTGRSKEAAEQLELAVKLSPDHAEAHNNLGLALQQLGRTEDAVSHYQKAIELNPNYAEAHNNLGAVLLQSGKVDATLALWQDAVKLRPDYAEARLNLGTLLRRTGRMEEAVAQYRKVIENQPNHAAAHYNLGSALLESNRTDEAIAEFEKAVTLRPDYAEAQNDLGTAYRRLDRPDKAIEQYRRAIEIDPKNSAAHYNLANGLLLSGRGDKAVPEYEKAIELDPKSVPALNNLAWVLATFPEDRVRDGNRAVELMEKAVILAGAPNAMLLRTQAAALAEKGSFEPAVAIGEQALGLATKQGNSPLADLIRGDLELYRKNQPFRESTK